MSIKYKYSMVTQLHNLFSCHQCSVEEKLLKRMSTFVALYYYIVALARSG